MIAFGIQTTLTRFKDRYFNYRGTAGEKENETDEDDNGLAIGSFEAAFCVDLCATYIFEMKERCFHHTKFKGIYQDEGLVIFLGKLTQLDSAKWLKKFQNKVDVLGRGDFFNFTTEIWTLGKEEEEEEVITNQIEQKWLDRVKIVSNHAFPFLGMQMEWKDAMLTFSVYAKPNHTIKYVGNMSYHCHAGFKAIPAGIFTRLSQLTSSTMENINQPITRLRPAHTSALEGIEGRRNST
eukprot:3996623-Ditylum_brightwellii.AAC.1